MRSMNCLVVKGLGESFGATFGVAIWAEKENCNLRNNPEGKIKVVLREY